MKIKEFIIRNIIVWVLIIIMIEFSISKLWIFRDDSIHLYGIAFMFTVFGIGLFLAEGEY